MALDIAAFQRLRASPDGRRIRPGHWCFSRRFGNAQSGQGHYL